MEANLYNLAASQLLKTSRTFFIPISQLPSGLWHAVASSYLIMRAIDEIEDHPSLFKDDKMYLLRSISDLLQSLDENTFTKIEQLFLPYQSQLAEVTLRMNDWIRLAPHETSATICSTAASMATGMSEWVDKDWKIKTIEDLDQYTFYVAGIVGILLSELWNWFANIKADKNLAIAYGRGLQAVNILRNRVEDLERGVSYFPVGWDTEEMYAYAQANLVSAQLYTESIPNGPIYNFCKIPLMLAQATLKTLKAGQAKLSRSDVEALIKPYILHSSLF